MKNYLLTILTKVKLHKYVSCRISTEIHINQANSNDNVHASTSRIGSMLDYFQETHMGILTVVLGLMLGFINTVKPKQSLD